MLQILESLRKFHIIKKILLFIFHLIEGKIFLYMRNVTKKGDIYCEKNNTERKNQRIFRKTCGRNLMRHCIDEWKF